MADRVVLLSIPQLRIRDVTPGALASLEAIAARGVEADFVPAFPSLAAASFATLITGVGPAEHGVIGDAYFDRQTRRVMTRPFADALAQAPRLWDRLKVKRPEAKSLAWFTPNLHGAAVDFAAWVDPDEGLTTQPRELGEQLDRRFGAYPAPRTLAAGEPLPLAATSWVLRTAGALIAQEKPDLAIIRVPYLGQIARRFGPDGREAGRAVGELEKALSPFLKSLPASTLVVAVTESVSTPVIVPFFPNLVLRDLGLLELVPAPSGGLDIDVDQSAAFALTDHQLCHIYLNDPSVAATVAAAITNLSDDTVDVVASGPRRARLGLNHNRAGDVILVATPDCWFAPHWWQRRSERPVQLDAGSRLGLGADFDPSKIQGSLGAPPPSSDYHGVIVASRPDFIPATNAPITPLKVTECLARALGLD